LKHHSVGFWSFNKKVVLCLVFSFIKGGGYKTDGNETSFSSAMPAAHPLTR